MTRGAVIALVGVCGLVSLLAQSNPPMTDLPGVLPPDATTELVALTADGQRTYYLNQAGEVWLFDRGRKTGARITGGRPWDLVVSPMRDAIAYTRGGNTRTEQRVWLTPLDPKTGLAVGPERRLSSNRADVPSISSDGKWVAFARDDTSGVGQSIVVVPIGGGAERVVVPSLPSSIDHIRWTPDGRSLYFGVNPPVACVPDWSCLPLAHDESKGPATVRRATVSGGPVSVVVATARQAPPGLSPDGTVVAYRDTSAPQRLTVTDPNGRPLGGFDLAANQAASGWIGGATLLVRSAGNVRRLHLTSLSGGPRVLFESADQQAVSGFSSRMSLPVWSPDGKTIAAIRCEGGAPCELRLLDADGSPRHTLPLVETYAAGVAWSPDQRWISYTGSAPRQPQRLVVIEVSTDRVVPLVDMTGVALWLPDSRRLLVSTLVNTRQNRRMSFRLVDVSGESTLLRDVALGEAPSDAVAIDASRALVSRSSSHDYRLVPLVGDGPERTILPAVDSESSVASFSPDRQWLVVRRSATGAENTGMNVVDLCRVDGSALVTIDLPFFAAFGSSSVAVLPGAKELTVVEAPRQDVDPGVYLVTVATKVVRKLFTYPARPARSGGPEIAVSPDGQTVLYTVWEAPTPSFSTMDLSVFRRPGGQ